MPDKIDINKPRWDEKTFVGRARHFAYLTNPLNCFKSEQQLDEAKLIVEKYRKDGILPSGSSPASLWSSKYLYDSAFHPETAQKQNIFGRMSFQVPGGMLITGILLTFYRTPLEIFLGQWLNQSFNALVNFTNRSGDKPLPTSTITTAYVSATSAATFTAIGLNSLVKKAPSLVQRYVPFVAVAAANMVNIPLMRQRELLDGVVITDSEGNKLGTSRTAAGQAITKVTTSRIIMAAPGMLLTPLIMEHLEKKRFMRNVGKIGSCGIQTMFLGVFLVVSVPLACAIFPQKQSISLDKLEVDLADRIRASRPNISTLYYNKGL